MKKEKSFEMFSATSEDPAEFIVDNFENHRRLSMEFGNDGMTICYVSADYVAKMFLPFAEWKSMVEALEWLNEEKQ